MKDNEKSRKNLATILRIDAIEEVLCEKGIINRIDLAAKFQKILYKYLGISNGTGEPNG